MGIDNIDPKHNMLLYKCVLYIDAKTLKTLLLKILSLRLQLEFIRVVLMGESDCSKAITCNAEANGC